MKYGLMADIHGNLEALEVILDNFKKQAVDKILCVGDLVGYGASPDACIDKVRDLSVVCVAGNHDRAVLKKTDVDYFNPQAKEAVLWTEKKLEKKNKKFLESLPLLIEENNFQLVHASLVNPAEWSYVLNFYDANGNFLVMKSPLLFIGHSHVPIVFLLNIGRIGYSFSSRIKIERGIKYIVNVGSVGQPRDGDPRACSVLYDDKKKEIIFQRFDYPIEKAQEKIRAAGLPEIEAARLSEGI